ncbi:hypothetical protein ACFFMN_23085 [Planobispora siamensis]|nr:hypothetical protein [Planobispora siamensis]
MSDEDFVDAVAHYAASPDPSGRRVFRSPQLLERTYDALALLIDRAGHRMRSAQTHRARERATADVQRYREHRAELSPFISAARAAAADGTVRRQAERILAQVRYPDTKFLMGCLERGMSGPEAAAALREKIKGERAQT